MYFNGRKKFVNNKFYLLIQVINYRSPENKFSPACMVLILTYKVQWCVQL
ncbi:hypothetical protein VCHA39O220_40082 [Vibrio chagasii]|nr:hypothetical protein VCHA39O220_40082 [Vibrio chagasii]CAH7277538.1 hypothetical protein VCHA39O224_10329 [Vibrio chagasii]